MPLSHLISLHSFYFYIVVYTHLMHALVYQDQEKLHTILSFCHALHDLVRVWGKVSACLLFEAEAGNAFVCFHDMLFVPMCWRNR